MLAVLAALIVALLLVIVGGNIASPGSWGKDFKVRLGLDLTSGTTVALKAQTPAGKVPSAASMQTAVNILNDRVNGAGFTEASVVPQGNNIINVSVPGRQAQQVVSLVGQTAQLRFREVLLQATNTVVPTATTTPSPRSARSAKASASPSAKVGATPTTSAKSTAAAASPSASASAPATPSPAATGELSTVATAQGQASLVTPQVQALFNKLNCANKNWQKEVGYDNQQFNNPNAQIVSCGSLGGVSYKFALDKAKVLGQMVKSSSATLSTSSVYWEVLLNFKSDGTTAWADMTSAMYSKYGTSSVLDELAVVLDGNTISFPVVQGADTSGSAQITGNFTQAEATKLANDLSYGALPLSFKPQSVQSITAQLGSDQLHAGLVAGLLGLLLVVLYCLLYYRGLAIVAVSSLAIAGLLVWEAVIVLGKYEGLALSLAGVAGLIVAIGITADSFVVFFERLRDEVRDGRTLRTAVERGWTRARRTILVSDTVSFLAAALLFYFSIGDVKGFAFTLGLTTLIDVVVVFLFTKPMITLLARTKFFGRGHPLSGLDPNRLGARAPWRSTRPARVPAASPAKEA